ncbi:beta-1,3-galactosyltransferase 1-like [Nelusetta ayraudi]|uniref:beta-1,3-galactosyltransferase 1-like n=1 Tax=Nelusetta ayraudi TaxID=303726 RepID=UPI003F7199A4
MTLKVSCLFLLTLVCWASALWYLSLSLQSTSYGGQLTVPKPSKNTTLSNVHTRSVNPHDFNYLVNEAKKCEAGAPFLVVLISTTHREYNVRQAIRETWGNESMFPDVRVVTLFLLGRSTKPILNQLVEQESQIFHDIVVEDFVDSYNNLTLKTLMGMRWVATFCGKAQYVLKTDSDMFINLENLIFNLLKPTTKPQRRYFTGYVISATPIRDMANKWYMPADLYPDSVYPPFCSGTGYVFSADMAELVYETSLHTRLLPLEDVYVAVCLKKLGIHPFYSSGFHNSKVDYSLCRYRRVITVHRISPEEMYHIWNDMTSKKHLKC